MITQRKTLCLVAALGAICGCQILTGLNGVHVVGGGGAGDEGGAPSSSSSGGSHTTSSSTGSTSTSTTSSTGSSTSSSTSSSTAASSAASSGAVPVCGNGMVEAGEECDDDNTAAGDGCGPTCEIEHPDACPGTPIAIGTGQTIDLADDTTGASDKFTDGAAVGNCSAGNYPGADFVYAVTPSTSGTLAITFTPTFANGWVHVRTECPGTKADEIACTYRTNSGPVNVSVPVTLGTTYYVVADSWQSQSGPFTLSLTLQ